MEIVEQEFKGKPVIAFKEGKRFFFAAGIKKIKLILENIDALKNFIAKYNIDKPAQE
jgi:hypothetical protein